MTKLFICLVLCLLLAMPVMAQLKRTVLADFEDAGLGVSQFFVDGWSCTVEPTGEEIEWALHPDSPPGNLGVMKATFNFGNCASHYIKSIEGVPIKEGALVADSLCYEIYLPEDIPDVLNIFVWVWASISGWSLELEYSKSVGDLVPGAWNTLCYPISEKIDAGAFTSDETLHFGFQHWPEAPGYLDTLYLDNFILWGIGEEVTALDAEMGEVIPTDFYMSEAYPNPFNPVTHVDFRLPHASDVSIKVYDMTGRSVKSLVNERKAAGSYKISWDGTNDAGQAVSSGTYLMKMVTNEFSQSQKFTLVK